jgi:hypothetical protein
MSFACRDFFHLCRKSSFNFIGSKFCLSWKRIRIGNKNEKGKFFHLSKHGTLWIRILIGSKCFIRVRIRGSETLLYTTFTKLIGRFVLIPALCSGGTFALQQPVFKERYFKLVGNLLFCIRLEGTEVLSLLVLETCSVQKEDKVGIRDRFHNIYA